MFRAHLSAVVTVHTHQSCFLWRSKQTFVDLGCGNGLLVDILTQEGYSGFGIDLNPVCALRLVHFALSARCFTLL